MKNIINFKSTKEITLFLYRLIGVFFITAALGKSANSSQIELVLSFLGFSSFISEIIIYSLIIFEISLGLLIIFKIYNLYTIPISVFTLIFFIGILVYLFFHPEAPECGCMGNIRLFSNSRSENLFGVFRNFCFIFITIVCWFHLFREKTDH